MRKFSQQLSIYNFKAKGSGKSGSISTSVCGQEVLERTACEISSDFVTVRFTVGFPANGRTINAFELEKILFEFLPSCVEKSLLYKNLSQKAVESVVFLAEDQEFLRQELKKRQLVAFVANHSILPRESGISQKPMKNAVPFQSPASLETEITLPHKGKIKGMAIPQGITLIAGGGYHGKSTLVGQPLKTGVYNHIAGDGREFVLTDCLRCESCVQKTGGFIKDVDISLVYQRPAERERTPTASPPWTPAAAPRRRQVLWKVWKPVQHLAAYWTRTPLPRTFMVRDGFMQQVISREKEPITPFLERAPQLFSENAGISTISSSRQLRGFLSYCRYGYSNGPLSGSGYYRKGQKALFSTIRCPHASVPDLLYAGSSKRITAAVQKKSTYKDFKMKCHSKDSPFPLEKTTVDLRYIEQLTDKEQTAALGRIAKICSENIWLTARTHNF